MSTCIAHGWPSPSVGGCKWAPSCCCLGQSLLSYFKKVLKALLHNQADQVWISWKGNVMMALNKSHSTVHNVVSWLVARFAIVQFFQIMLNPHALFGRFTIVARNLGRPFFVKKNMCKQIWTCVFWKNTVLLVSLFSIEQFLHKFHQISKALGHERVQFTLVGLFSGFTIAANFSRADPGAKRRKKILLQKYYKYYKYYRYYKYYKYYKYHKFIGKKQVSIRCQLSPIEILT